MRYSEEVGTQAAETASAPKHDPIAKDDPEMPKPQRTTAPAFQLYAAEFLGGDKVSRMSYTEIGIFTVLLCHAWNDHGLIPNVNEIAKKLKLNPRRFGRIWQGVLSECWVERNGRLVNPRQEKERKKQADYRKRQSDAAASRWHKPDDAVAMPERVPSGNALLSSSPSPSSGSTHRQGGAPLHQSHKSHAACGRVCVPGDLHAKFVRARNHDGADRELRDWYLVVDNDWSVGAHKDTNPGGNDYTFWRARFDEKWPPVSVTKPATPYANWRPRAGAQS